MVLINQETTNYAGQLSQKSCKFTLVVSSVPAYFSFSFKFNRQNLIGLLFALFVAFNALQNMNLLVNYCFIACKLLNAASLDE